MIHDLADLLGVGFGQRAAEHREVLAEDEHDAAVHRTVAGHDAVARYALLVHAEIVAAVLDEHVPLFERARIEQQLDSFTRREFALGVLAIDALLTAAQFRRSPFCFQLTNYVLHVGSRDN